jgi:hypothetical protein
MSLAKVYAFVLYSYIINVKNKVSRSNIAWKLNLEIKGRAIKYE